MSADSYVNLKVYFLFQMLKTPRNILIANLALSNIFLSLFTMPLTLLDLIHKEILCQLPSTSQSAFVFFSSFSVVLIAVDRLLLIVYPSRTQISTSMVVA